MSPTSYRTAPPRIGILRTHARSVKAFLPRCDLKLVPDRLGGHGPIPTESEMSEEPLPGCADRGREFLSRSSPLAASVVESEGGFERGDILAEQVRPLAGSRWMRYTLLLAMT